MGGRQRRWGNKIIVVWTMLSPANGKSVFKLSFQYRGPLSPWSLENSSGAAELLFTIYDIRRMKCMYLPLSLPIAALRSFINIICFARRNRISRGKKFTRRRKNVGEEEREADIVFFFKYARCSDLRFTFAFAWSERCN